MWTFGLPTKITFGSDSSLRIAEAVRPYGRRPLFVTDSTLVNLPFFRKLATAIPGAAVFAEVQPNPTTDNVDALCREIHARKIDVLVAVGGGSSLDCAKAASCLCCSGESSIRAFHTGGKTLGAEHLPVIALPTTAGTGSEVTPFAVLDDREKGIKAPLAAAAFFPVLAIIDPALTVSMPLTVTAGTGCDALSHALEAYWSKNHQPICDLLAQEAARLIFANLEQACREPNNLEARAAMSYAALLAGMAFQLPKNAMVHACSFPLSKRIHLPHGAACAFTLEFAIHLNTPHMGGRMEQFASYCGFRTVPELIQKVTCLKTAGGLPCTLAQAGIRKEQIPLLVEESFHPLMANNPKAVTREDLQEMYRELA